MSKENAQVVKNENGIKRIVTRTKREENQIKQILSIINQLGDIKVVLVYDELDKMDIDILDTWFKKYKNLFIENNFFNFFLVSDKMYAKYSNSDFWINPLYTYFSGIYYMKLLSFEDTLRYCCMTYSNILYERGLAIYYTTVGNYRLINVKFEDGYNVFEAIKGYILKEIVKKIDELEYEPYLHDILIGRVKRIIERFTKMNDADVKELNKNWSDLYDIWPGYLDIKNMVIEEIRILDDKLIYKIDEKEIFNRNEFMKNKYKVFETIKTKGREYENDIGLDYVSVQDMYHCATKDEFLIRTIPFLPDKIKVKRVGVNAKENYHNILLKIILANLHISRMQVIILERKRGNESLCTGDIEYTGIVFVDKEKYVVAYYVDRGSYKSDGYSGINSLIEGAKKLGVNVKNIVIDKYMDVGRDINEIVNKYNRL